MSGRATVKRGPEHVAMAGLAAWLEESQVLIARTLAREVKKGVGIVWPSVRMHHDLTAHGEVAWVSCFVWGPA